MGDGHTAASLRCHSPMCSHSIVELMVSAVDLSPPPAGGGFRAIQGSRCPVSATRDENNHRHTSVHGSGGDAHSATRHAGRYLQCCHRHVGDLDGRHTLERHGYRANHSPSDAGCQSDAEASPRSPAPRRPAHTLIAGWFRAAHARVLVAVSWRPPEYRPVRKSIRVNPVINACSFHRIWSVFPRCQRRFENPDATAATTGVSSNCTPCYASCASYCSISYCRAI